MRTHKTIVIVGFSTCFFGVRGSEEVSIAGTGAGEESSRKGLLGESRSGKPGFLTFFSFSFALWVVGGGVARQGTTAGALREGGGENNPVWPRRRRWGAGGGEDEGERVRERARVVTRLVMRFGTTLLLLLDATAVEDEDCLSPSQNCSSARASLSSSAMASRVIVLRLLWPTVTSPSLGTSEGRRSSLSDSGWGTSWSSSSSDDESVTRERERRLRLWVVRGGVGGMAGPEDAARLGMILLTGMESAAGSGAGAGAGREEEELPAPVCLAARTRGIVQDRVYRRRGRGWTRAGCSKRGGRQRSNGHNRQLEQCPPIVS